MSEVPHGSPTSPGPADSAGTSGPVDPPSWMPRALAGVESPGRPRLSPARLIAAAASALLVIALLAWALPWATGTSWSQIGAALGALPWWAVPAMALLGSAAVVCEAGTVRAAIPGSRFPVVLRAHAASAGTALAVPGGSLWGLGLLAWIVRRSGIALPRILTGVVAASLVEMVLTSMLIPVLGLGAYALGAALLPAGIDLPGALWAGLAAILGAGIALALTALLLRRPVLVALLEQASGMLPAPQVGEILAQRDALVGMLRRRPLPLVLPTLAARLLQYAALLFAFAAAGIEVPLLLTVAAFGLGRLLSLVPLTPGGAGIAETVIAAALVSLGVAAPVAAAAMLLLLVAMLVVPVLAGGAALAATVAAAPAAADDA